MKSCPVCQRTFPNDAGFCPADGTALSNASMAPVAPSADDPRLGARLCERYDIRRVVADGGMGRVYEGIDRQTDSRVAVKVLHAGVAKDPVALERFKKEYEISSLLPHDHIVRVLDFQRDVVAATWMLVMEFLDGEELRVVLKRDRVLPPERLIRMISQIAIALDEAHARSFIHRDLKPDNVFLCGTRDGDVVKLLDFGSVKDQSSGNRKKLTVLGTTIGSPYYMSPEQVQGLETIDRRADVFALGTLIYECITGEVPFTGNNGPSIFLSILTKIPAPPTTKTPGVPPAMDQVLGAALAKNAAVRTATVGALADAIGAAYGLGGDHLTWAATPQSELARQVAEAAPRVMAPRVAPLAMVADPFASPPSGSPAGHDPGHRPIAATPVMAQAEHLDRAFEAVRQDEFGPTGLPSQKPAWFLPVVVGVVALLVGGTVTLVVMLR